MKNMKYLTAQETADMLRVGKSTLYAWTKKGFIKRYMMGGKALYSTVDIELAIESMKVEPIKEKRKAKERQEITKVVNESRESIEQIADRIQSIKTQAMRDIADEYRKIFIEQIRPSALKIGIEDIIRVVSDEFSISFERMMQKTRIREVVIPRHICFWMIRSQIVENDFSLSGIGRLFGKFDHATVLHGVKTIDGYIETDKVFRETMIRRCARLGVTMEFNGRNLVPVKFETI